MSSSFQQIFPGPDKHLAISTTVVEGLWWIGMVGPSPKSQISPQARHRTEPLKRLDNWDLNAGRPRLIDWATVPDWYDRNVHWRGWIPRDAVDSNVIPCPSESGIPREPLIVGTQGKEYLSEDTIEGAFKLNELRKALLDFLPDIKTLHIPIPAPAPTSMFDKAYEDAEQLGEDLCRLCYGMVDLVGFFRWASSVFSREIASRRVWYSIVEGYKWLDYNFRDKSIGYLVHLEAHRTEFSFQFCIQNGVPLYYPWYNQYREIPCLKRFDPFFLGLDSDKLTTAQAAQLNFFPFNRHLQEVGGRDQTPVKINWPSRRLHRIVDFEGWVQRELREGEDPGQMEQAYYWEDCMTEGGSGCYRFYHLWRPSGNCDLGVETSSDDGDGDDPPIHNPCIIREHYKFRHAPSLDDEISPVTYSRTKSLQDYRQPTIDRLFGEWSPELIPEIPPPLSDIQRRPARQPPRATPPVHQEETSGNAAGEDANLEMGLTNAMRDNSGSVDSTAMDVDSTANASMSTKRRRNSSLGEMCPSSKRRASPEPHRDLTSLKLFCQERYLGVSPALASNGTEPSYHPYLSPSSTQIVTWNEEYLRRGIIHFPDARSEVKLRLWALSAPLTSQELVQRALERHVPFSLTIGVDDVSKFRKAQNSNMESYPVYYRPAFRSPYIVDTTDGYNLWNNYLISVNDLLSRPHARALVFEGGLVSRLVQEFAPRTFYEGVLYGPSLQVTRYGKGYTNPNRNTVDDEVSSYEVGVVLGFVDRPQARGIYSIWPPRTTFNDEFRGWNGEWDAACERWFQDCLQKKKGHATAWSEREWKQWMRKVRVEGLPKEVKQITPATWDAALDHLQTHMVYKWQDRSLADLTLPIHM